MIALPVCLLALAAGVYLLMQARLSGLGGLYRNLSWLVIILSLLFIFAGVAHRVHRWHELRECRESGHCKEEGDEKGCLYGHHAGCGMHEEGCAMHGAGNCKMMGGHPACCKGENEMPACCKKDMDQPCCKKEAEEKEEGEEKECCRKKAGAEKPCCHKDAKAAADSSANK